MPSGYCQKRGNFHPFSLTRRISVHNNEVEESAFALSNRTGTIFCPTQIGATIHLRKHFTFCACVATTKSKMFCCSVNLKKLMNLPVDVF